MRSMAILAALLLLSGCAQNGLGSNAQALYFPACYAPLHDASVLDSRARDIGIGAGKGFLAGALAGLAGGAVSALFTGDPLNIVSGAAIGAAGGTVAGGAAGAMNDNLAEKNRLMAQWQQETSEDIEALSFNQAAATMAMQCYNKRLAEVQKDIQLGVITNAAAQPMLTEIEVGRQEAANLYGLGN